MNYYKGDLVLLDSETMWHADTLFTVMGKKRSRMLYDWYILKHLYPPHPFGTEPFYINVNVNNLWKFPLGQINELIDKKTHIPIDIWKEILSFIIRKQDQQLLF